MTQRLRDDIADALLALRTATAARDRTVAYSPARAAADVERAERMLSDAQRALNEYETAQALESKEKARSEHLAGLYAEGQSGVPIARTAMQAATAALDALQHERVRAVERIAAVEAKATAATVAFEAEQKQQVADLVAGRDPQPLTAPIDYASALKTMRASLVQLDREIVDAQGAVAGAKQRLASAIACRELSEIYKANANLAERAALAVAALRRADGRNPFRLCWRRRIK
jgi:hypothetical protein